MNKAEINKLGLKDIDSKVSELKAELKDALYKNALNDLSDKSSIQKTKRNIARLLTRKNAIHQGDENG